MSRVVIVVAANVSAASDAISALVAEMLLMSSVPESCRSAPSSRRSPSTTRLSAVEITPVAINPTLSPASAKSIEVVASSAPVTLIIAEPAAPVPASIGAVKTGEPKSRILIVAFAALATVESKVATSVSSALLVPPLDAPKISVPITPMALPAVMLALVARMFMPAVSPELAASVLPSVMLSAAVSVTVAVVVPALM